MRRMDAGRESSVATGPWPPWCSPPARAPACARPRPKVLHPLCGRPMLLHVVDALVALPLERIVIVVGHGAERVTKTLQEQLATEMPIEFVEQRVQRGTGDAVSVALTAFSDDPTSRATCSSCPATRRWCGAEMLARLATEHREARRRGDAAHRGRSTRSPSTSAGSSATTRAGSTTSSSRPTPPPRSSRSTRSTPRSTASAAACSRRRCAGSAPRTRRASTT